MDRRTFLAATGSTSLVGAAVGVAGCLGLAADDYDVGMTTTDFTPETITVTVGETVVWQNTSSRGHTVTAYEGGIPADAAYFATGDFESESDARAAWNGGGDDGMLGPGASFSHQFDVAGRYDYVCLPHERGGMIGTVVVEEPSPSGD